MKKKILVFCFIILINVLTIRYVLWFIDIEQRVRDASGLDLTKEKRVFLSRSAPSFHGDGWDYEIYEFSDLETKDIIKKVKSNNKWNKYPLDSVSSELVTIWSSFLENDTISQELLSKSNYTSTIPDIENGYYLLLDRANHDTDTAILERSSLNFSLFLFDTDNNTIYYLILDT